MKLTLCFQCLLRRLSSRKTAQKCLCGGINKPHQSLSPTRWQRLLVNILNTSVCFSPGSFRNAVKVFFHKHHFSFCWTFSTATKRNYLIFLSKFLPLELLSGFRGGITGQAGTSSSVSHQDFNFPLNVLILVLIDSSETCKLFYMLLVLYFMTRIWVLGSSLRSNRRSVVRQPETRLNFLDMKICAQWFSIRTNVLLLTGFSIYLTSATKRWE